jgi:hypothetical protein
MGGKLCAGVRRFNAARGKKIGQKKNARRGGRSAGVSQVEHGELGGNSSASVSTEAWEERFGEAC